MGFFSALVRTTVNIATLPVSVMADVVTLGGVTSGDGSHVIKHLNMIKEEASED